MCGGAAGYFDAPATKMAALGEPSEEGIKAELPLVTLVFCAVNGLKAMRVSLSAFGFGSCLVAISVRPTCVPDLADLESKLQHNIETASIEQAGHH